MAVEIRVSDEERSLILQLLEREHNDLPTEMHHTQTAALKDQLRHRRQTVRALLEKLQTVRAAA